MTNTNLKELKKRFEANVLDGDSIYDCGNTMLSVDIVWDFIETAVLEAEVNKGFSNFLMVMEEKEKEKKDERKRIMEIIENMPEFANGTMGDVISKNDILQKIKEME